MPARLLALQRLVGNRAVTDLLRRQPVPRTVVQRAPVRGADDTYTDAAEPGVVLEPVSTSGGVQVFALPGSGIQVVFRDGVYYEHPAGTPVAAGKLRTLALERHFGGRGAALKEHEDALLAESTQNKTIHGRARHGFQTGWEGQRGRARTKRTPDQVDDPLGTGLSAESRTWKTSTGGTKSLNAKGKVVAGPFAAPARAPKPSKSGGPYAGAFFSPEHQNEAITTALAQAKAFETWDMAKFTGYSKDDGWAKIMFVEVVVMERKDGYGYSFGRNPTEGAFATRIEGSALGAEGDKVYSMKCAKVQLRKLPSGWQVLSSFPENLPPGASPVQSHGEFPWTGDLKRSNGEVGTMTAPVWPHSKKADEQD